MPLKTKISPENWWLEDDMSFSKMVPFQGEHVNFRGGGGKNWYTPQDFGSPSRAQNAFHPLPGLGVSAAWSMHAPRFAASRRYLTTSGRPTDSLIRMMPRGGADKDRCTRFFFGKFEWNKLRIKRFEWTKIEWSTNYFKSYLQLFRLFNE